MALKLKKEIKKSSYYVWFLGAKESKGLRGTEFILPVIGNLEEREKDIEPFKVTLQVSHKGLKIIQNIVSQGSKSTKPKNEIIKHFIPHNTITCVHQKDDIIACILLLFNPVTKCPLHVHAYRCDSLETATLLKGQLQMLIERPENQKKFSEIENRLVRPTKELKKFDSSIGSDTGTSTRESESSEERFSNDNTRVATLYDSVAAELRAKLNKNDVPILLPPRDYDTVHRQKGNLTGIELRRCLNSNIVGQSGQKARRIESSGGSSGIGSDHAPSPESPDVNERYHGIDGHSTSDDEWNADTDTTLYLMNTTAPTTMTLNRTNRNETHQIQEKYDYRQEQRNPRQFDHKASKQHLEEHIRKKLAMRADLEKKYNNDNDVETNKRTLERERTLERSKANTRTIERQYNDPNVKGRSIERQTVQEKSDRFFEAKRAPERSRMERYQDDEQFNSFERPQKAQAPKYVEKESYVDEDFDPNSYQTQYEREFYEKEVPVPKIRQKYVGDENSRFYPMDKDEALARKRYKEQDLRPEQRFKENDARFKDSDVRNKENDSRFKDSDVRYKENDARFKDSDVRNKETDSRFKDSDVRYKENDPRFKDSDVRYKENDSRFKEVDSRYKEPDNRFKETEPRFKETEPRYKETEARFKEQDRFKESESRFKEPEPRFKEYDSRFKESSDVRYKEPESRYKETENIRYNNNKNKDEQHRFKDVEMRYKEESQRYKEAENQKYREERFIKEDNPRFKDEAQRYKELQESRNREDERFKEQKICKDKFYPLEEEIEERFIQKPRYLRQHSDRNEKTNRSSEEYYEDTLKKRTASSRQRSPSPNYPEDVKLSPRDRFKDAKEKFLLLERERLEQELKLRKEAPVGKERKGFYTDEEDFKRNVKETRHLEAPISPVHKDKPYIKRHESMMYQKSKDFERYNNYENGKGRYFGDRFEQTPKPAPRTLPNEEVRYRRDQSNDRHRQDTSKFDPKRRSMFNLTEADHKKASNDIAKELKRRSYMEQPEFYEREPPTSGYYEMDDKHKSLERSADSGYNNNFSKSNMDMDQLKYQMNEQKFVKNQQKPKQTPANYRNSYAEPKYRPDKNANKKFEVLHRNNSTVSNNGRVGIASIHPY